MNEVNFKIMRGSKVLIKGTMRANPEAYERFQFDEARLGEFLKDAFNIERYVNAQGYYRCHVEAVKGGQS